MSAYGACSFPNRSFQSAIAVARNTVTVVAPRAVSDSLRGNPTNILLIDRFFHATIGLDLNDIVCSGSTWSGVQDTGPCFQSGGVLQMMFSLVQS